MNWCRRYWNSLMWDNHQTLNSLANLLYGAVALMALYFAGRWVVSYVPLLPLTEVTIMNAGSSDSDDRLKHVTREQIGGAVRSGVQGNFFTVDLEAVQDAFEKVPWVRFAGVRRIWPNGLEVSLEEQVVLARWSESGLVNMQGELFEAGSEEILPVFEGPEDSSAEITRLYAVYNALLQPLEQKVARVELSPRRAWRIQLESGTVLELGREQVETRLERYVRAMDRTMDRTTALRGQLLAHVDLRYPSGFAVR